MQVSNLFCQQEPVQNEFPRLKSFTMEDGTMSERPFMDIHMLDKLHLNEDMVLRFDFSFFLPRCWRCIKVAVITVQPHNNTFMGIH